MKKVKYIFSIVTLTFTLSVFFSSCFNDLNTLPIDEDIDISENVFKDEGAYKQFLAKLYAGLAVTGQQGPDGNADIEGIDEGFGQYIRGYWYHQELTTEEAIVGWNDQTIKDFHEQKWLGEDAFIFALYSRIFYQISICNEFLRETTDEKLEDRAVTPAVRTEIQGFRAEARFLRALSYWHALDLFRNIPFVTEDDIVGAFFPEQTNANDLFSYLETELLEIENTITPAKGNEYGRADQGAVWALLAKLYLNSEVYTGQARNADCLTACNNLINAGYTLDPNYGNLFLADNNLSDEIIFPIVYDGISTLTWGGTTFIIRAGIGGSMNPADSGVQGGWGGTRTTRQLVEKFGEIGGVYAEANPGNTVLYPKVYTPGSFQGFDWSDTENALSSINSDDIFEGYKYFPEDNGEFFVAMFPSEGAQDFGDNGADGTLEPNGESIKIPTAGLYYINVDMDAKTYTIEKQDWGVLGDATSVGWDEDIDLVYDAENNAMRAEITTTTGNIKFRANDDWAVSLGDDGFDGLLQFDGADIPMEPGEWEVLLYLNRPDYTYKITSLSFDRRPFFHSDGQTLDIVDVTNFSDGYAVNKFKNVTSDGTPGSNNNHPDTDFPVFRMADFYLMAAEAILRDGGSKQEAADLFNVVRTRAFGSASANVSADEMTLELILDERARELYWECHRRTDLIRFGQFTDGDYVWQWKGGVMEGTQTESFRNIFPIPAADLGANPNLVQNPGY